MAVLAVLEVVAVARVQLRQQQELQILAAGEAVVALLPTAVKQAALAS